MPWNRRHGMENFDSINASFSSYRRLKNERELFVARTEGNGYGGLHDLGERLASLVGVRVTNRAKDFVSQRHATVSCRVARTGTDSSAVMSSEEVEAVRMGPGLQGKLL